MHYFIKFSLKLVLYINNQYFITFILLIGTERADQYPCPLGTFGNATGYNSSLDCSPCLGGQYCGTVGKTEPTGPCEAGYYCQEYCETSTPNQGSYGDICPQVGLKMEFLTMDQT